VINTLLLLVPCPALYQAFAMTVITAAVNLWPVEKKKRRRLREKGREGEVGNSTAKFMNP